MNSLKESIEEAKKEIKLAEQHLNFSDKDFIEVAIYEYSAKKAKLNALLKRAKASQYEESH